MENTDAMGCSGGVNTRGSGGRGGVQLSNRGGGTAADESVSKKKKKKEMMKKGVDVEEMRGEERKGEMSNGA